MDINIIYNMNLNALKKYLMDNINNPDIISLLYDRRIKEKILNAYIQEFCNFLEGLPFEIVSTLLDNDGVDLLAKNDSTKSKIVPIIERYSKESNLFKNKHFCNLVCIEIDMVYGLLYRISAEAAILLIEYALEAQKKFIILTLCKIRTVQLEVIKRIEIPYDKLLKEIDTLTRESAQYILDNDERINSLLEFSFEVLCELVSKGVIFPKHLLYENKFVNWLTSIKNVKKYRLFVESQAKNQDVSFFEEQRKKFYENEINSYDVKEDMLARYSEFYHKLLSRSFNQDDVDELFELLEECFVGLEYRKHFKDLIFNIEGSVFRYNYKKIRALLQSLSHLQLTNMIIDYHFEDIAYNIFLDVEELLNFNSKVKVITEEDVLRYNKILNLDNLSYQEAKELFEGLKNYHYSLFYDHIRMAKDKAIDLMEQVILNEETIQKYRNKELSEQHGVDVYVLDGDEYYALVRAFMIGKTIVIEADTISYDEDGASFSLDCSVKRDTYIDPRDYYNLIYSSFPKNQIVHIFSADSFSNYKRGMNEEVTSRVYEIRTPEELVKASRHYNEIVIAKQNSCRTDELNSNMQNPKVFGIYCFDEIEPNDVISAKNLKVGIVLVKTIKYDQYFEGIDSILDKKYSDSVLNSDHTCRFDYIRDFNSDDMKYRKRL